MLAVSNQALCGGGNRNIGFYFKVTFPVGNEGDSYAFKTPTDFGLGGISKMDGEVVMQETSDIWEGGRSTKLDFTTTLSKGNHQLELFGSEGCCDGTTRWCFSVNGGDCLDFTTANLDGVSKEPVIPEPEPITEPEPIPQPEPVPEPRPAPEVVMPAVGPSEIYIKTIPYTSTMIGNLGGFKDSLAAPSPSGYCEKNVDNMLAVGNQALCGGGARDVGFYFKVTFPVANDGDSYAFKTPTDFGYGGLS